MISEINEWSRASRGHRSS